LSKTPLALAHTDQRYRRRAECLREQHRPYGGTATRSHEHQQPAHLEKLEPFLPVAVHVPDTEGENDAIARKDGDGAGDGNGRVGRRAVVRRRERPHARHGQRGRHILEHSHKNKYTKHRAQRQIQQHEKLAQPAQDPVALEIVDEGQQRGEMGGGGEQREHPDDEEVVGHHGVEFGEADALDADAGEQLLVAEGEEQFAEDFGFGVPAELVVGNGGA
jgi:hypothetical protein